MDIIGLDLHKRESQLCIGQCDGTIKEQRIVTSRERFSAVLGHRPRARILLEAATESEWVAQHLEALGHEVIVADPNFAPMYATRSRRVKTDKRDARTLYEAAQHGTYRPAHRLSAARRHVRAELAVRDTLVRTRSRCLSLAKALVRREGLRVASSQSRLVMRRIHELPLPAGLSAELAPLVAVVTVLTAQIDAADERLAALVKQEPAMQRLQTLPGIGPVTACAVVASADAIHRFPSAHEFEAYLGLVPSEQSSGEKRRVGAITKTGNAHVRWLLIEAAWRVLRSKRSDTAALRVWARRVAARRGKWVAVVALARRLAGILYAMWRDEVAYDAKKIPLRLPRARA